MPKERKPGKKAKDKPNEPFSAHLPAAPGPSDIPSAIPEPPDSTEPDEEESEEPFGARPPAEIGRRRPRTERGFKIIYDHSKGASLDEDGRIRGAADAYAKQLLELRSPQLCDLIYSGLAKAHQLMNIYDPARYPIGSTKDEDPSYLERVLEDLEAARAKLKEVRQTDEFGNKLDYKQIEALARGEPFEEVVEDGPPTDFETDPYEGVQIDPETFRIRRGPKTVAGKEAIRLNALKHGLLSKEAFIVGEVPADFLALSEALRNSLAPEGALEDMLVERIITAAWRLRRAVRAEKLYMNDKTLSAAANEEFMAGLRSRKEAPEHLVGDAGFERLLRYETTIERSFYRALVMLQGLQEKRTRQPAGGMGLAELVEAMVSSPLGQSSPQPAPDGDGPPDGTGPIEPAAPHGPIDPEVDP